MGRCAQRCAVGDSAPVSREAVGGRAVVDRRTIHVEDIMAAEAEFPETVSRVRRVGFASRTMLATPLLREGTPLGVIMIARGPEARPFSPKQIALLETFAESGRDRHRERPPVQRAAGADGRADALGGAAHGTRRGRPRGQLDPGPRDRAADHRDREPISSPGPQAVRSTSTTRLRERSSDFARATTRTRATSRLSGAGGRHARFPRDRGSRPG